MSITGSQSKAQGPWNISNADPPSTKRRGLDNAPEGHFNISLQYRCLKHYGFGRDSYRSYGSSKCGEKELEE